MMEKIPTQTGTRDQLMNDLKSVIQDAESWLRSGPSLSGEDLKAAKEKFERTIAGAKADLVRYQEVVVERTKEAGFRPHGVEGQQDGDDRRTAQDAEPSPDRSRHVCSSPRSARYPVVRRGGHKGFS